MLSASVRDHTKQSRAIILHKTHYHSRYIIMRYTFSQSYHILLCALLITQTEMIVCMQLDIFHKKYGFFPDWVFPWSWIKSIQDLNFVSVIYRKLKLIYLYIL